MNVYKLHHQNAAYKSKYSRQLEELKDSKEYVADYPISYHDLIVLIGAPKHILKDDAEWHHIYVKYPFTMNFVRMKESGSSGQSSLKDGFCYSKKLLKPVTEESYDSKIELKYDNQNMLYAEPLDFMFLEHMSEDSVKDIDWSQFTFDDFPTDIYVPLIIVAFIDKEKQQRYLFVYRLKYDENYDTFAAIIEFSGEFPIVERMTVKQWDVYRDGGTTKAVLEDSAGKEHNLYVPTAFKPLEERIPTYDDKEYTLIVKESFAHDGNTSYFDGKCKRCADALGIQLFKERERR